MAQKLRCYICGKVIENEKGLLMKNVSAGFLGLSEERKPFHSACWEMYHRKEKRKNMLIVLSILLVIGVPIAIVIVYYILHA